MSRFHVAVWVGLVFVFAVAVEPARADVRCRVVGVHDGDSLTCLVEQAKTVKVRLSEIDAPELGQAFGRAAKKALSDACFGADADLNVVTQDKYGRTVARVSCDGVDVNARMVSDGMAWVYDRYATDTALYGLQDAARAEGRGLWSDRDRVPPWQWRRNR